MSTSLDGAYLHVPAHARGKKAMCSAATIDTRVKMPPKKNGKEFQWTDEEAELLLNVTYEYKVKKSAESIDWESVRSKYDDIFALMQEYLPNNVEEDGENGKDYPHSKQELSKAVVSTKLKNVRLMFRQAVDSGRRSGHGRVVMLYFELCEKIWGGSPATTQIEGGLETTDLESTHASETQPVDESDSTSNHTGDDDLAAGSSRDNDEEFTDDASPSVMNDQPAAKRRKLLDAKLHGHRQEKLSKRIPVDHQMLTCAQEELGMKKKLVDQMERMEKEHTKTMYTLSNNIDKLTSSISDGFAMLRCLMSQPPLMHPPSFPYGQSTYQRSFHPARDRFTPPTDQCTSYEPISHDDVSYCP